MAENCTRYHAHPEEQGNGQRPIEAHGIVGDLRSAALVADDGCVDFFCWPDFDSPTVFASLLDTPEAGIFDLAPVLPGARRQQLYVPDTNVLQTRWLADDAVVLLTDFMPICDAPGLPRLVRRIEVAQGEAEIRLECRVRHDYGRADTQAEILGSGDVRFSAPGQPALRLSATTTLDVEGGSAVARFRLGHGEHAQFTLGGDEDVRVDAGDAVACLRETEAFWRRWLGQSQYKGRWREAVNRSALALKLLTSRDGAILAAATFGLPEARGGERNWDYRYTWIRDASFTVYAFMRLGFTEEANAYMRWLRKQVHDCQEVPGKLRILYGIDGRQELPEETLDHLSGYGGAKPVRIGNEAYAQVQLDIYGELLDAVYLANKYGEAISHDGWQQVVRVVDHLCETWQEPDVGIWEMRGEAQHFLHSRLMCWVALDRAIRLANKRSLPAPFARWDCERTKIHEDIWTRFWDEEGNHFVQHIGSRALDGSMLLMPLVRFVSATDPRWLSTLGAIEKTLVRDGMVYRYRTHDTPSDALPGEEGAFAACSFWYVECLARAGRIDEAHLEFEQLLRYANPVGLYAEEFDKDGRPLGNLPQALTHLALISAATYLDRTLNGGITLWKP
ncbi:glycoside hydrolase family 15 protein [Pseudomonas mangiferae]|uniref:Glycoside hydrolase family 15 protein n=1 Tax=Pseudomonas mangiferae TaxID=2593654 RepID=A0A553H4N0_9PSED|nr:glycoside hydrolase family 15 protein [Pseudomonas mangiferae]TRX76654.1 glycoside hydrolase family 15 protein [Pseudomonas mangiferae]